MRSLKQFYHTLTAQVVIVLFILIKVLLIPYLIWKFWGTSSGPRVALDLATILVGTGMALSMGMIGYYQAHYLNRGRMFAEALWCMIWIHGPVSLFLLYKWLYGAAWNNELLLILSGWLSMFSHPMNLVGFYGQWVDGVALLAMGGCYMLGVVVYYDEQRHVERLNVPGLRLRGRAK